MTELNPDRPERTRAVLQPNSETLWADICAMNQRFGGKWTDRDALEMEARLVLATSPPLCLDPNPHLARVANHVMRVSTPTVPVSLKRKAATSDPEEDETDKARRAKIMAFMNSRQTRSTSSYRVLDAIQRRREKAANPNPNSNPDQAPTPVSVQAAPSPTKPPTPSITVSQAQSPAASDKGKPPAASISPFPRANGSVTPAPQQQSTHQFINQTPPNAATPNGHSPLLPQVYPSVQAATEAAKRTPTPAQKQFAPSPRPPSRAPALSPASVPAPVQQVPQQTLQPPPPNAFPSQHFMSQPPPRGVAPKAMPPTNGAKLAPQQQYSTFSTPQQAAQFRLQAHAMMLAQQGGPKAAQQNGRGTPAQLGAGLSAPPTAVAARNSPMAGKQPITRSPMPPTTQLPPNQHHQIAQQALAMQQQAAQHPPPHTFTPSYNPAQLRPGLVHGNIQVPPNLAAAAAQAHAQGQRPASATGPQQQQPPQQQPHMYMPQMYGYPVNYTPGQQLQMTNAYRQYLAQQQQARMHGQAMPQQPAGKATTATVLGGGLTGLSSAFHLSRRFPTSLITLLERQNRLGGWVKSVQVRVGAHENNLDIVGHPEHPTVTLEAGPRTLRPNSKSVLELINLLDLQSKVLTTPRTASAARSRFLYLPDLQPGLTAIPTSVPAFLQSPLWKLLLPAIFSEPIRSPNRTLRQSHDADESLDSFLSRRFGPEVARVFGSALCHGVYAADSRQLSVRAAFPALYDLEEKGNGRVVFGILKDMLGLGGGKKVQQVGVYELGDVEELMRGVAVYSFRGGVQTLTDTLAKALSARPNVELSFGEGVKEIEMCEDVDSSLAIHTSTRTLRPSHVVSALPLPLLDTLLSPTSYARPLPHLTANPTSSVTVLSLVFAVPPNTLHPPGFGYLVPRPSGGYPEPTDIPDRLSVLGTVFDSCALPFASNSEGEYTKLTVMLGGPYPAPLPDNDDELRSRVLAHLTESLQMPLPSPVASRVWHHVDCIPTPAVGHIARLAELRQVLEEKEGRGAWRGRLEVVGAGVGGVSVGDCVEAGRRVGRGW
ncbi:hypothetical protein DXG01_013528 [Tephrocybe rancida]|nr:hypothetical protein DXG01_013528 [Tephrocybe rancida]